MQKHRNAIISAARTDTIGATLYLAGKNAQTGDYVSDASSCAMCKKLVINAGIERVVVRMDRDLYKVIPVEEWIRNDDSISGSFGY